MTKQAFAQRDWQAVINAHPLESHDPKEWLWYGVALLQTLEPGEDAAKQLQQAALAFVQAQKEGATPEDVANAQRRSAQQCLNAALAAARALVCYRRVRRYQFQASISHGMKFLSSMNRISPRRPKTLALFEASSSSPGISSTAPSW